MSRVRIAGVAVWLALVEIIDSIRRMNLGFWLAMLCVLIFSIFVAGVEH